MSTIIEGKHNDFIEKDCCFKHEGTEFCSGGSWLLKRIDTGLRQGVFYHYPENHYNKQGIRTHTNHFIGTWDGSTKVHAVVLNKWRSNFGDERIHFCFKWIDGKKFWGINAGDNCIVRVREYKNQN